MVNGPRPSTITSPAAAAAVPSRAPSTPTVLTRQHTSIYSTASTTTPVLVYGKEVTPLAGNWADEPWSPSNRAAPVGLVDTLDAPVAGMEDDNSSLSNDTAVFDEARDAAPVSMFRTVSDSTTTSNAQTAATAGHVSFVFRYDPYAMQSRTEMYRCTCDECVDRANVVSGVDILAAPIYSGFSTFSDVASMGQPMASYDTVSYDHTMPVYADQEDVWASSMAPAVVEVPQTPFMPPPPPPRITRRVIAESAEPTLDAESAFYLIIMRWYEKVSMAQANWILNDDRCPEPNLEKYSFDEWVDEIGRWWLRHFEHVQVKSTSASSVAIRTAASAGVRRPGGFETHAGVRQVQPRRQFGTSGLTAEMLDSHNQSSAPAPHTTRPRRELPW